MFDRLRPLTPQAFLLKQQLMLVAMVDNRLRSISRWAFGNADCCPTAIVRTMEMLATAVKSLAEDFALTALPSSALAQNVLTAVDKLQKVRVVGGDPARRHLRARRAPSSQSRFVLRSADYARSALPLLPCAALRDSDCIMRIALCIRWRQMRRS